MSSPHARGSSIERSRPPTPTPVVPARAGIFRLRMSGRVPLGCRPRTRGDLPRPHPRGVPARASSPHARGSSGIAQHPPVDPAVVPARAGIFRRRCNCPLVRHRRPRTRGDLPVAAIGAGDRWPSSPHARGSSHPQRYPATIICVVPARAGIFLLLRPVRLPDRRRPRTRGDLPSPGEPATAAYSAVPARAGIFPPGSGHRRAHGGRPRTRGDLPRSSHAASRPATSSPHARGSSPTPRTASLAPRVVPARAGIFPASIAP